MAAGVPGAFGAIITALSHFGRLRFEDVSARAIELAKTGFPAHAGTIRQHKSGIAANFAKFKTWPGTAAIYLPGGRIPKEGELLFNPALADMYLHLVQVEKKPAAADRQQDCTPLSTNFIAATLLREIVRFSKDRGGLLEQSDFDTFEIPIERSVSVSYAGAEVHKCGPWNQGPALLQSLTILKNFDLRELGHNSAAYIHTVLEAIKLAFADREQFYGDPGRCRYRWTCCFPMDTASCAPA